MITVAQYELHICGTVTSLSPFLVAEQSLAPVVTATGLPAAPVPLGTSITITAAFNDANPGDTHTASVAWDDGATSAGNVTESNGAGSVSASHTYTAPGVYTLSVSVSDGHLAGTRSSIDDQPAYVVVYDPNGGFVTGGGWINSPAGAYPLNATLSGKATFGFVSKYHNGAAAPSGNTEFQFHAGNFNFSSTSYQWLVVAGARAQYKGEGSVNGQAGYSFLLSAVRWPGERRGRCRQVPDQDLGHGLRDDRLRQRDGRVRRYRQRQSAGPGRR